VPEVHLPHIDDEEDGGDTAPAAAAPDATVGAETAGPPRRRQSRSLLKIGLEVLLISAGVFLGLLGEQWRERAHHRELAEASLRRFRTEMQTNRKAVADVQGRHRASLERLLAFFKAYDGADPNARQAMSIPDVSTDPAFLEYSAWDLALATQSLEYIDQDVAFAIAHVYAIQRQLDEGTRAVTQAMYATGSGPTFVRNGLTTYLGDCTLLEPRLLAVYDGMLARLDRVLGGTEPPGAATR
jgi:hypothetical protein